MSDDEYDNILFNKTDGIKIIEQFKGSKKLTDFEGPIDKYFIINVLHNITLRNSYDHVQTIDDTHYIFKKFLILFSPAKIGRPKIINIIMHNLPNNILFFLKTIYLNNTNNISVCGLEINQLINFYDKNTNYFKSKNDIHYKKLELKYKEEKEMIERGKNKLLLEKDQFEKYQAGIIMKEKEKQTELDKLILENQQKIDYYKSLEQQIIDVNKEKEIIKEEKRKIAIVKEKMAQQKREFDEEKFKFELEKDRINDIDVDKFINSVLD